MNKVRVELNIRGKVQGVFFRQSTKEMALRLGVTGWAKNLPDRSVQAVFEGDKDAVAEAIAWCHQGPPAADVTAVDIDRQEYRGEFETFRIRY